MANKRKFHRVVITGLGVVSSIGIGCEDFWESLINGKSGIAEITSFDTSAYDRHFGGEVKNFNFRKYFNANKRLVNIGRTSQMAIVASKLALEDAEFLTKSSKEKLALSVGTTTGEIQILENHNFRQKQNKKTHKLSFSRFPSSSITTNIGLALNLSGLNDIFTTACASGNYAIGHVYDQIKHGKYKYGLAGGADAMSRIVFTGFCRLMAVAPEMCQPFDVNRKGMIPAEGAGMLFLETLESAEKRKAKIYAEVLGYGLSCDAHHMTDPSISGVFNAMNNTLMNSGISPDEIDYICAHGTGTKENDIVESQAIKQLCGNKNNSVLVSSIKSMLGHTMGAASALGAISCCLAIKNQIIPPNVNLEKKDPDCGNLNIVNEAVHNKLKVIINNSQAFGGNNCCLVFGGN